MPSIVLGFISGGTNILSGNYWSGQGAIHPIGGVQLRADRNNSGNIYVGYSGGVTVTSGGFQASGLSGGMDGMQLGPGDAYFVPKIEQTLGGSGSPSIFMGTDANCSGQARIYWECV